MYIKTKNVVYTILTNTNLPAQNLPMTFPIVLSTDLALLVKTFKFQGWDAISEFLFGKPNPSIPVSMLPWET